MPYFETDDTKSKDEERSPHCKNICTVEKNIINVRKQLKKKIIGPSSTFRGHEKEVSEVRGLLKRTITMGESNSALLIGPRGCGKTTLMDCVLRDLTAPDSLDDNRCVVVRLHGLIHTTDALALRDAARQMGLENAVGDTVFGSFAENLKFLFDSLKAGDKVTSKAVVFILDEFEMFCDHHNQTLLYNLFDVTQSNQAPVCVVGLTCRLDVTELLEKRVKSRFSHRQIYLFPSCHDLPARMDLFRRLLHVEPAGEIPAQYVAEWNKHVDQLAQDEAVRVTVKRMYDVDVGERALRLLLTLLVSDLDSSHPRLTSKAVVDAHALTARDAKTRDMESLSVLELSLVIAMKHHSLIYDGRPFNFEVILSRYLRFLRRNNSSQTASRPVIMKAYEHLLHLEYVAAAGGEGGQAEYRLCHLLVLPHQVEDAVRAYRNLPTEVEQWAKSSLQ